MEIASSLASPGFAAPQTAATRGGVISSDFETFLKMLTVQMQNQDPLNPIKSEDYAVQLATFSGVEQQVRTNELIEAMATQLGLMGLSQMAGWVGMEARAPVSAYFDGSPIVLTAKATATADRVDLVVRNANGAEVQRLPIPASGGDMEWAGVRDEGTPLASGLYTFATEGFTNGASLGPEPSEVYATIVEARAEGGQTLLITRGGVEVPATAVTALRDPSALP